MTILPFRKLGTLLLGLVLGSPIAHAQTETYLSLDEAVAQSAQNNSMNQQADLDRRIARARRHQTDAIFLPQVSVGYNALLSNDPLNAFGFLLQQRQVSAPDFDPARLNHPGAAHNFAAQVEFQMPLINVDKIYARKGARLQEEVYAHQAEYTADQVRFEVQKAYTQLQFAYQAQAILRSTLCDVQGIYRSVSQFYEQGLLQKSDVLQAQVQVNTLEAALSKAGSHIHLASDGLRLLIGEDIDAEAAVYSTDPLTPLVLQDTDAPLPLSRPDILALNKAVKASQTQVKSAKMAFVPTLNAFGNFQFNDERLFGFKENSYLLGLSLKWTLFSGNRNRNVHKVAISQYQKMRNDESLYLNKSRMDLEKNKREMADLRLEIQKNETSVQQAQEALRIMGDRHREGLVNTTDLLLAQAQHSQQQLALAQAVMNYNIACYYHYLLTNTHP